MTDEELLLALLNTRPKVDGVRQDHLADDTAVAAWLRAHDADTVPADGLRAARDALQDVVRDGGDPAQLSPLLAEVTSRPVVDRDGLRWEVDGPSVVLRAVRAWDALRVSGRVRPCANTACQLFLIDHSKANTARWCSMAVCGNRMKARRHYERARGKQE